MVATRENPGFKERELSQEPLLLLAEQVQEEEERRERQGVDPSDTQEP